MQLVFAPNSPELAATTQFLVQGALQQWLGNLIALQAVDVEAVDSTLRVTVRYMIRRTRRGRDGKLRTGRLAAMIYHCCDELRRNAVAAHPTLNGIDYLEVLDNEAPAGSPRQRTLFLRLLKPVPASFTADQLRIDGGERVRDIHVEWVAPASSPPPAATPAEQAYFAALPAPDHVLVIRTDRYGDYSPYLLSLVRSPLDATPPQGFDPRLSEVELLLQGRMSQRFRLQAGHGLSRRARLGARHRLPRQGLSELPAPDPRTASPSWCRAGRDHNPADVGVTLAELIAYVGDQLSYRQDAIATEAYLSTARLRRSLRRHALLVDYHLHDGCNARSWIQLQAGADNVALPQAGTRFYSRLTGMAPRIAPGTPDDEEALRRDPTVFEPLHDATLYQAHNEISFYAWGDRRCCLPRGRDIGDADPASGGARGRRRAAVRGSAGAGNGRAGRRRSRRIAMWSASPRCGSSPPTIRRRR